MNGALVAVLALVGAALGAALEPLVDRVPRRAPLRGWTVGDARPQRAVGMAVVTGASYGGLTARYHDAAVLPAYLVLGVGLVALSVIDLEHLLLPNRLVYPLTGAVVVLLAAAAAIDGNWSDYTRTLFAGATSVLVLGALHVVSPGGMGMGDVKLAAPLGLALGWLGWGELVLGAVLGFVIAALVALGLVVTRRVDRRDHLPFGPFLSAGTLTALLVA